VGIEEKKRGRSIITVTHVIVLFILVLFTFILVAMVSYAHKRATCRLPRGVKALDKDVAEINRIYPSFIFTGYGGGLKLPGTAYLFFADAPQAVFSGSGDPFSYSKGSLLYYIMDQSTIKTQQMSNKLDNYIRVATRLNE